jgi:hypothetical protein
MPAVKISARLKLDENISFLDGHYLRARAKIKLHFIFARALSWLRRCLRWPGLFNMLSGAAFCDRE